MNIDKIINNDDVDELIKIVNTGIILFDDIDEQTLIENDAVNLFKYFYGNAIKNTNSNTFIYFNNLMKISANNNAVKILTYLIENYSGDNNKIKEVLNDVFLSAADRGKIQVLKCMLEKGADIHYNESAALRWAIGNSDLNTIKFLIDNGADFNSCENAPLSWVGTLESSEVLEYIFIEKKQDVNILLEDPIKSNLLNNFVKSWLLKMKFKQFLDTDLSKKENTPINKTKI